MEIRARNLTQFNATIQVTVEKSWVTGNNVNKEKIVVYRYDEDTQEWQELPTKLAREDAAHYYYDAVTRKFSVFSIVEKPIAPASTPPAQSPPSAPSSEETPPSSTPTPPEKASKGWIWLMLAIVVIIGIIAWLIVFIANKKK